MHKVLQTAQGLQAAALSAWRAELQRQRQACQQSNVLLTRVLGHRLGASFAGWQAWAAEQHAVKARLQRAVGRLQALQMGAVLLEWRAVTAERRLLRGKAGKALRSASLMSAAIPLQQSQGTCRLARASHWDCALVATCC